MVASTLDYTVIDAFTPERFRGNPAAVILLEEETYPDDSFLQKIGREFNLSETAFLIKHATSSPNSPSFHIRWFTPTVEIALCGHATLASAHFLYTKNLVPKSVPVSFHTQSGFVTAGPSAGKGKVELDFPAEPSVESSEADWDIVGTVFGLDRSDLIFVGRSRLDVVVEVSEAVNIEEVKVDFSALATLKTRGLIITRAAPVSYKDFHFISRVFSADTGIPEDPVTGSAHCTLAVHWSKKLGKENQPLAAYQASERGGILEVTWLQEKGRVKLVGDAVVVAEGKLFLA
ncbi:hypothetical protein SpCBS45565_g05291 [Spizellomyces sp. 'palustris']|nr:hypothetical protein SpCBS45565_g05291 [Spizellomyces sp. 'palustris']